MNNFFNNSERLFDEFIPFDVYVNNDCNLNCNSCVRFAKLFEHSEYPLDVFENDLKKISSIAPSTFLNLTGGEPLLNKNLIKYIEIASKYITRIVLSTNGILLLNKNFDSQKLFNVIRKHNVVVNYSDYYPELTEKIEKIFEENNIISINFSNYIKKLHSTDGNLYFQNNRLCENRINPKIPFFHCKEVFGALMYGKLYQCGKPLLSIEINKRFKTNFKISEDDFLDIFKIQSIEEIKNFYKRPKAFCGYCRDKARPLKHNNVTWSVHHTDLLSECVEFKQV